MKKQYKNIQDYSLLEFNKNYFEKNKQDLTIKELYEKLVTNLVLIFLIFLGIFILHFFISVLNNAKKETLNIQLIPNIDQTIQYLDTIEIEPYKPFANIKIWSHKGGSQLKTKDLEQTIYAVIDEFNITADSDKMAQLIFETAVTETHAGIADYSYAAKNYKNYGMLQLRADTAEFLKKYIKRKNPHDYQKLMSLRNNSHSEEENLLYNVPYSIAMCLIYYYQRDNNIVYKAYTLEQRANLWKKHYNTYKGKGSPEVYIQRVKKYFSHVEFNRIINV